jgi:hypothetical protein
MRQTAPQESQNLYANKIQISNSIVKGRWFYMLASMELYARSVLKDFARILNSDSMHSIGIQVS